MWALNAITYESRKIWGQRHGGKGHVKTGAEIGVRHLQAKESQGLLLIPRTKEDPSLEPSERAWPCQHLDFGLLVCRTVREYLSLFCIKPPSVVVSVTAAPGN